MPRPAVLDVKLDTRELVRFERTLELWAKDQLPFATAAALTDTAKDAQAYVRNALFESFTVRNQGFKNAIGYQPASKRGKPIQATVGVKEWARFLVFHAIGGLKRVPNSRVAVPTRRVQRVASGRVRAADKPRKLRDSKKLVVPALNDRGQIAIRRKDGVAVYYHLVGAARIKPRWPFWEQVRETVEARLGHHFRARAEQALKTAR